MADEGLHVVVTIASNGVVHAWGEGPVVTSDPTLVKPFATRRRARAVAAKFKREAKDESRQDDTGHWSTVDVRVCKVLGIEPVEVKRPPT